MASFDKEILCIKKDVFFSDGSWTGFQQADKESMYQRLLRDSEFKLRVSLERDKAYLQIIPQVVLRYKNTYFLHKQVDMNEKRLNSLCPLLLGGHVSEVELDKKSSEDFIQQALNREVSEEVTMTAQITARNFIGFIYLDDNDVNSVHIGVIHIFDVDKNDAQVKEAGLETIGWVDVPYLKTHLEELTYWSRIIVDYLEA